MGISLKMPKTWENIEIHSQTEKIYVCVCTYIYIYNESLPLLLLLCFHILWVFYLILFGHPFQSKTEWSASSLALISSRRRASLALSSASF